MKIIFLDIDGVLNSERSFTAYGAYPWPDDMPSWVKFDRIAVGMVRRLCKDTGAHIVLSSSWRSDVKVDVLGEYLSLPIIDKTTERLYDGAYDKTRGMQIEQWCHDNRHYDETVIIDDMDEFLHFQQPKFIHVDSNNGFSYHNYLDALRILGTN